MRPFLMSFYNLSLPFSPEGTEDGVDFPFVSQRVTIRTKIDVLNSPCKSDKYKFQS